METLPDLTAYTDDDLEALFQALLVERDRRATLARAAAEAAQIAEQYLDARDGTEPVEDATTLADAAAWPAWVQPTGAHDAYPAGRIVSHGRKLYRSLIAANVWEPGAETVPSGLWEEVTAADAPSTGGDDTTTGTDGDATTSDDTATGTTTVPEWDGNGHAYTAGDQVTYQGAVYTVVQSHTSQADWAPDAVPALYTAA